MVGRDDLHQGLMDRSSNFRLKVEDQKMMQFNSSKNKQMEFLTTLRNKGGLNHNTHRPSKVNIDNRIGRTGNYTALGTRLPINNAAMYQHSTMLSTFQGSNGSRSKSNIPMGTIVNKHSIPRKASKESARFRQPSPDIRVRETKNTFDHLASTMFKTSEINLKAT